MQYEVWARDRQTKVYELIEIFYDEKQKYSKLDLLDSNLYCEAMVLRTEWQSIPACILFKELKPKVKTLQRF